MIRNDGNKDRTARTASILFLSVALFCTGGVCQNLARFSVLYEFQGQPDGNIPDSVLIGDLSGNAYGETSLGGAFNSGSVYELNHNSSESVLYSFTGGNDGASPSGGLIRDVFGNLYGTTVAGGAGGLGVVFELMRDGSEMVLHSFGGGPDGANPNGLAVDAGHNLYGTTSIGGTFNQGTVFKIDNSGNESVLYNFPGGSGGQFPNGGLLIDKAGNLYGTTSFGGASGLGTAFKLNRVGEIVWSYSFAGSPGDGATPESGLVSDLAGNFYGVTTGGGFNACNCGTIFRIDSKGHETVLYKFLGSPSDGSDPIGPLVRDSSGNLYGSTQSGGPVNSGSVFYFDTKNKEHILHGFTDGPGGATPVAPLAMDPSGRVYGTTSGGGNSDCNCGIIFKLMH